MPLNGYMGVSWALALATREAKQRNQKTTKKKSKKDPVKKKESATDETH